MIAGPDPLVNSSRAEKWLCARTREPLPNKIPLPHFHRTTYQYISSFMGWGPGGRAVLQNTSYPGDFFFSFSTSPPQPTVAAHRVPTIG